MRRPVPGSLALLVLLGAGLACGDTRGDAEPRGAAASLAIHADTRETGYIGLRLDASPGVPVRIDERLPGGSARFLRELTPVGAAVELRRVVEWRCDRRVRTFVATAEDGTIATTSLRTPSCRHRLSLAVPRRVRQGLAVRYRLSDRWRLGDLRTRLCVEPPGGPARCSGRRIRDRAARGSFSALRRGVWRLRAEIPGGAVSRRVRARGRLTLLATGDSMIQIIDSYLEQRLRPMGVRMRSEAHISTGISKPSLLNWHRVARRQAARRPGVVVMFLGANDGYPMGEAACCGGAWIAEYARRARRMMRVYGRGGRTRVYWLLLPTPRGGFFRETFPAVNKAIRRAAARSRRDVRVIDLVEVFTPGGRYRSSMPIGRRTLRVRQRDGVHLSPTGASLTATILIRTLRRERILP